MFSYWNKKGNEVLKIAVLLKIHVVWMDLNIFQMFFYHKSPQVMVYMLQWLHTRFYVGILRQLFFILFTFTYSCMTRRVWLCIICSPFTSNHIIRNIIEQPYWYVIFLHLFLLSMLFIRYHVFIYIYCTKINNSLRLYWFLFEVITCYFNFFWQNPPRSRKKVEMKNREMRVLK